MKELARQALRRIRGLYEMVRQEFSVRFLKRTEILRKSTGLGPLAMGRKNYLFAGSHQNARFYSLLGTYIQLKINPEDWLTDVLERWPTHPPDKIVELLPNRWKPPV